MGFCRTLPRDAASSTPHADILAADLVVPTPPGLSPRALRPAARLAAAAFLGYARSRWTLPPSLARRYGFNVVARERSGGALARGGAAPHVGGASVDAEVAGRACSSVGLTPAGELSVPRASYDAELL